MNLLPSVITSFVITGAIWILAVFQPGTTVMASDANILSATQNKHELTQVGEVSTQLTFKNVHISGVSENIPLSQLPNLWQDFNDNKVLQNNLKAPPSRVYVYYRDFSSDYESATTSIGYDINELKSAPDQIKLPITHFEILLNKGKYNDIQIQQAWEKLDYRKNIVAIVEIHYLNADSSVNSSEIFVSYK